MDSHHEEPNFERVKGKLSLGSLSPADHAALHATGRVTETAA